MGLNEFAGYVAVAASALATGWIAARYGVRPEPFYLGVVFAAIGLVLSAWLVRETRHHVSRETALLGTLPAARHRPRRSRASARRRSTRPPSAVRWRPAAWRATWRSSAAAAVPSTRNR
jgi:MFS family permease